MIEDKNFDRVEKAGAEWLGDEYQLRGIDASGCCSDGYMIPERGLNDLLKDEIDDVSRNIIEGSRTTHRWVGLWMKRVRLLNCVVVH